MKVATSLPQLEKTGRQAIWILVVAREELPIPFGSEPVGSAIVFQVPAGRHGLARRRFPNSRSETRSPPRGSGRGVRMPQAER
jgi:hypothetical protein